LIGHEIRNGPHIRKSQALDDRSIDIEREPEKGIFYHQDTKKYKENWKEGKSNRSGPVSVPTNLHSPCSFDFLVPWCLGGKILPGKLVAPATKKT
jgi:hypothetical protein